MSCFVFVRVNQGFLELPEVSRRLAGLSLVFGCSWTLFCLVDSACRLVGRSQLALFVCLLVFAWLASLLASEFVCFWFVGLLFVLLLLYVCQSLFGLLSNNPSLVV